MCEDAAVIKLNGGLGVLEMVESNELYSFALNGKGLFHSKIPACGTCATSLSIGYGLEKITVSEINAIRELMNEAYTNLSETVNGIAPLIGLLKSGTYLVADHLAFPVYDGGQYFWNDVNCGDAPLHMLHGNYGEVHDFPVYLFASQTSAAFNKERMLYYEARLDEGRNFPRAFCLYVSGGTGMVLDGHHKIAAAAYMGKPARCLTIMPVNLMDSFGEIVENGRLTLRQERFIYGGHNGVSLYLDLCAKDGRIAAQAGDFTKTAKKISKDNFLRLFEDEQGSLREPKQDLAPFSPKLENYPKPGKYSIATMIPRDRMKSEYEHFLKCSEEDTINGRRSKSVYSINNQRAEYLKAFYEVFPEQKWLSEAQYKTLDDYITARWDNWVRAKKAYAAE
jgi:hypothetical protein